MAEQKTATKKKDTLAWLPSARSFHARIAEAERTLEKLKILAAAEEYERVDAEQSPALVSMKLTYRTRTAIHPESPQDGASLPDTESLVCGEIRERQAKGIAKYGTTVSGNPLSRREWVQHAYEECLDMAIYLRRLMQEMDRG
jgi:hypothetical protein